MAIRQFDINCLSELSGYSTEKTQINKKGKTFVVYFLFLIAHLLYRLHYQQLHLCVGYNFYSCMM